MRSLSVMVKPASGTCNMHCDYCFYCDEMNHRSVTTYGMMAQETIRDVIRRTLMFTEEEYSIAFQGGEPTLCGIEFFRYVMACLRRYNVNNAAVHLALQTNGYGINEEWASFFAENDFLIGLSVDGLPELHRKYRHGNDGGDSYEHVMRAAALFDQFHVEYNILTVVHHETAGLAREIYADYKTNGWKYLQFINCLDPLGEPHGSRSYSLLPQDYGRFMIDLFDCWYEDWKRGSQPYIRQFENLLGILLGYAPEACEQRGTCGVSYVVEADGSVYPCDFYVLDGYVLGNFRKDVLPRIDWKRKETGFVEASLARPEKCRVCRWYGLCRNGCRRCRGEDGINCFCESYQMFFERCYPRLKEMAGQLEKENQR